MTHYCAITHWWNYYKKQNSKQTVLYRTRGATPTPAHVSTLILRHTVDTQRHLVITKSHLSLKSLMTPMRITCGGCMLFLYSTHTQKLHVLDSACMTCSTSFLFHGGYMISTFIKLIKRWPFYEISTDPPLHEVNSRQHDTGVSIEYQCCYRLFFFSFFTSSNFPSEQGNFPLGDMDLVKDIPV